LSYVKWKMNTNVLRKKGAVRQRSSPRSRPVGAGGESGRKLACTARSSLKKEGENYLTKGGRNTGKKRP